MRGHITECLEHFKRRFNTKINRGARGRIEALQPLADFCGVSTSTISRMMDGGKETNPPQGIILIKLTCYLDFHGYRVIEFERMSTVLRNFAELIGYEVLPFDEIYKSIGYSEPSKIYRVIWGNEGFSKEKETRMWEIWKEYRDQLEQKKLRAFENYGLKILFKPDESVESIKQQVLLPLDLANSETSRRLALLHILKGALGFFDGGLFDNLSSDEISSLNQSSGHTINRLAIHLSSLSLKLTALEE